MAVCDKFYCGLGLFIRHLQHSLCTRLALRRVRLFRCRACGIPAWLVDCFWRRQDGRRHSELPSQYEEVLLITNVHHADYHPVYLRHGRLLRFRLDRGFLDICPRPFRGGGGSHLAGTRRQWSTSAVAMISLVSASILPWLPHTRSRTSAFVSISFSCRLLRLARTFYAAT